MLTRTLTPFREFKFTKGANFIEYGPTIVPFSLPSGLINTEVTPQTNHSNANKVKTSEVKLVQN